MYCISIEKFSSNNTMKYADYVFEMYTEPLKYNYRFLEDCISNMGRMNCMKRWRIHGNNIVSSH